jgi:hypothetical protein
MIEFETDGIGRALQYPYMVHQARNGVSQAHVVQVSSHEFWHNRFQGSIKGETEEKWPQWVSLLNPLRRRKNLVSDPKLRGCPVTGEYEVQEIWVMKGDSLQESVPTNRIESVGKIQLDERSVWPHLIYEPTRRVNETLAPSLDAHACLWWK